MKYRPSLPEHNDNVSHQNPVREFFLILAGLAVFATIVFWSLGWAIDLAVDHMSPETEARIHRAVSIKWTEEKPHAPEQAAALEQMLNGLRACAGVSYPVTLQLVEGEQPNAAVLPGAHIVVFSGLLDQAQSRNALSFVLAHELSHLKNRDHLRGMGRSLLLVAISAALTGADSGLTQILVPVNQIGMARHSQKREMEADNTALDILQCHYGHAGGATEFFEALRKREQDAGTGGSHYFASHPELQARIDNLNRRITEKRFRVGPVQPFERKRSSFQPPTQSRHSA
jgi:Zn-dependent protease with chaperone function